MGNTGDGILMAEAVGAVVDYSIGGQYTYIDFKSGLGIQEEAGLFVTEQGERVCNEYAYQYAITAAMVKHASSNAYYITDKDDPNKTAQYAMTLDSTFKADSPEELAELIGMDPATLKATIERYNTLCQQKNDEDFGKPAEFMNELTDTLYAMKLDRSSSLTYGGIKTNTNAEVINKADEPIPGLYAAGEAAFYQLLGTEVGINYPSCGTAIVNGVIFGKIAGEQAAALK